MASSKYTCEARILDQLKATPVPHSTTKECGAETNKRMSVDSGEAYMSICSSCFKRFIRRSMEKGNWFGWFDCDYPPEAQVVGSKWYYENVVTQKVRALPTPQAPQAAPEPVVEKQEQEQEQEAVPEEPEVEELQALQALSIAEKPTKEELKQKIKDIQKLAKPGKMTLKEIQAAFKEITELRAQIHML